MNKLDGLIEVLRLRDIRYSSQLKGCLVNKKKLDNEQNIC